MKPIRHIFFDLDNTLWDFTRNSASVLEELYQRFALEKVGIPTVTAFVERYEVHNEYAWKAYREGRLGPERLRWERYWRTLADFSCDDRQLAMDLGAAYLKTLAARKGLMPGARQVLQELQGKYPLHIITNGFADVQRNKLRSSGLDAYFQSVTTAESAGAAKPDPRIFRSALADAGALAGESLYIGDHAATDSSALAVGMQFLWYNPQPDSGNPEFDPKKTGPEAELTVLQDLLELPLWLSSKLNQV